MECPKCKGKGSEIKIISGFSDERYVKECDKCKGTGSYEKTPLDLALEENERLTSELVELKEQHKAVLLDIEAWNQMYG
jgi:excinuclease UvrABC ATPase subunit